MITITQARVLIWIILSAFFFKEVIFPLIISSFLHLWTSIKHSKFIYIIINFIIISILIISSTSFAPFFSNVFLKLHKTLKYHHDDDDHHHHHQASHSMTSSPDDHHDDVWWFFSLPHMDNEPATIVSTSDVVDENDASFDVQQVDKHGIVENNNMNVNPTKKEVSPPCDEDKWWFFYLSEMEHQVIEKEIVANNSNNNNNPVWSHGVEDIGLEEKIIREEGGKDDSLDATWKAIMESKEKESKPHLKKSDTWSAGDGGVEERRKGGLSKYRVNVQLKKWESFKDMIDRRNYFGGGGGSGGGDGGGGGGGGKRGWKSVDMALTFHDEFKKRADAFIDRFTDNIRLQRLESNQRFMDLMNRSQ